MGGQGLISCSDKGAVDPRTAGVCSESAAIRTHGLSPRACELSLGLSPQFDTNTEKIGDPEVPTQSDPTLFIVAHMTNGGLTFGWTYAVFADPSDALNEQADAHDAGLTGEQVWELRCCRQLVSVPAVGGQCG